jgi:SAM-dependent methyltransferase
MNPAEYELMAALETDHWWYRGLRDILARILTNRRFALPHGSQVLDAGCGTGENLRLLRTLLDPAYLGGFDISDFAVARAAGKMPGADVYRSDICAPELRRETFDLIVSCDVIYVCGVQAAFAGLQRLTHSLRSGGLLLLHLPALNWLYSRHDVAVHTYERFTARDVRQLLRQLGLNAELVTYRVFTLFPAIVFARLPSILGFRPTPIEAKSDLALPGRNVNNLLTRILQTENAAIGRGLRFPWGTSLIAVGRKP